MKSVIYGLNGVPTPHSYVEVLTPRSSETDLLFRIRTVADVIG